MNPHQSNQAFWNASANWWKEKEDHRGLWKKAHENPSLVLGPLEMSFFNNIEGKVDPNRCKVYVVLAETVVLSNIQLGILSISIPSRS